MDEQVRINVLASKIYKVMSPSGSIFSNIATYDMCKDIARICLGTDIEEKPEKLIASNIVRDGFGEIYKEFLQVVGDKFEIDVQSIDECEIPNSTDIISEIHDRIDKVNKHIQSRKEKEKVDREKALMLKIRQEIERERRRKEVAEEMRHYEESHTKRKKTLNNSEVYNKEEHKKKVSKSYDIEGIIDKKFFRLFGDRYTDINTEILENYVFLRYKYLTNSDIIGKDRIGSILADMSRKLYYTAKSIKRQVDSAFGVSTLSDEYEKRLNTFIEDVNKGLIDNEPEGNIIDKVDRQREDKNVKLDELVTHTTDNLVWRWVDEEDRNIITDKELDNLRIRVETNVGNSDKIFKAGSLIDSETLNIAVAFYFDKYDFDYITFLNYLISELKKRNIIANIVMSVLEADVLLYSKNNNVDIINFVRSLNVEGYERNPVWNTQYFPCNTKNAFRLCGFHPEGERIAICDIHNLLDRLQYMFSYENGVKQISKNNIKLAADKVIQKSESNLVKFHPRKITKEDTKYWNISVFRGALSKADMPTIRFSKEDEEGYINAVNNAIQQCNISLVNNHVLDMYEAEYTKKPAVLKVYRASNEPIGDDNDITARAFSELYYHNNKIRNVYSLEEADILLILPSSRATRLEILERAKELNENITNEWERLPKNQSSPLANGMIHPIGEKVFICTPKSLLNRIRMLYGGPLYSRNVGIEAKGLRSYMYYESVIFPPTERREDEGYEPTEEEVEFERLMNQRQQEQLYIKNAIALNESVIVHNKCVDKLDSDGEPSVNSKTVLMQPVDGLSSYEVGAIKERLPAEFASRIWKVDKLEQFYKLYLYSLAADKEYVKRIQRICDIGSGKFSDKYLKERIMVNLAPKKIKVFFADQIYRKLVDKSESTLKEKAIKALENDFRLELVPSSNIYDAHVVIINKQSPVNDLYVIDAALTRNEHVDYDLPLDFYITYNSESKLCAFLLSKKEHIFVTTLEGLLNRIHMLLEGKSKYKQGNFVLSDKNNQVIQTYKEKYFKGWDGISYEERAIRICNLMKYYGSL